MLGRLFSVSVERYCGALRLVAAMVFLRAAPAVLLLSLPLAAQDPSGDVVFRAETERMQVEAQVLDKQGNPIEGLTVADFELSENGERREIVSVDYIPRAELLPPVSTERKASEVGVARAAEGEANTSREHPLWVYVSAEAGGREFQQVHNGLEKFLREKVRGNMAVSIGGLPFAKDREQLLAVLEQMRKSPLGRRPDETGAWLPSSIDVTRWTQDKLEEEREEAFDPRYEAGADPQENPTGRSTSEIDEQLLGYNRFRLYRYLDLIDELSVYPGKKVAVVFVGGLRVDPENLALINRIAGEAARRRVAFYMVDSRGLDSDIAVTDIGGLDRDRKVRRLRGPVGNRGGGRQQLTLERGERFRDLQHGMEVLADQTRGRFLFNANDMSGIFDSVADDTSGYYLLTFRPIVRGETEAVRRIRIKTPAVPGAKLRFTKKYYEPEPYAKLGREERRLELHRLLLANEAPDELTLRFDGGFFPDPERAERARFVYSLAVPTESLTLKEVDGRSRAELGLALRAYDPDGLAAQTFDLQSIHALAGAGEPFRYARHSGFVSLPPGRFRFKIVVRDEETGRAGSFEKEIVVPDFTDGLTASTLLLTSAAAEVESEDWRGMFDVAGRALLPRSPTEFRQGDLLYALYDLVGGGGDAPAPMKIALLREKTPVADLDAQSEVFAMPESDTARYFARIDTTGLEPGEYTLFALLPEGTGLAEPYVYRTFVLRGLLED